MVTGNFVGRSNLCCGPFEGKKEGKAPVSFFYMEVPSGGGGIVSSF